MLFLFKDTFAVRAELNTTTGLFERLDHPLLIMLIYAVSMTLETEWFDTRDRSQ